MLKWANSEHTATITRASDHVKPDHILPYLAIEKMKLMSLSSNITS